MSNRFPGLVVMLAAACSHPPPASPRAAQPSSGGNRETPSGTSTARNDVPGPATQPTIATPVPPPEVSSPPAQRFPPPPEFPELARRLQGDPRGARCFIHNVIPADLTAAYADADLDGDGRPERVWQLPDCIAVIVQGAEHWEIPVLSSRPVSRDVDAVSVRAVTRGGRTVVEVTDTRSEPVAHDVYRFRWTGSALEPAP